jgi:hypothetical protein
LIVMAVTITMYNVYIYRKILRDDV